MARPPVAAPKPSKIIAKVICRECGKQMLRLSPNHLKKHDMTFEEYIAKYGPLSAKPQVDGKPMLYLAGGPQNTLLTEETHAEIMNLASKGYPKTTIAATVGISTATLDIWLKKGAPDNVDKHGNLLAPEFYYKFAQDYRKAEALAEITAIDYLRDAGKGDWRAALEFLARRYPHNWRPETKHSVDVNGQVDVVHSRDLDIEKLLEDPETAELACTLLEKLSTGDRLLIEGEAEEVLDDDVS